MLLLGRFRATIGDKFIHDAAASLALAPGDCSRSFEDGIDGLKSDDIPFK
jgi:hypothetical protein